MEVPQREGKTAAVAAIQRGSAYETIVEGCLGPWWGRSASPLITQDLDAYHRLSCTTGPPALDSEELDGGMSATMFARPMISYLTLIERKHVTMVRTNALGMQEMIRAV